jgi:hypothetical protein
LKNKSVFLFSFILISLVLGACASPSNDAASGAVLTEAALIAAEGLTQTAAVAPPTATATEVLPTSTNTNTPAPTATQAATQQGGSPAVTATQQQSGGGGNVGCLRANFEIETIPDGTQFFIDREFTKTWRLKNVGSCTWTPGFSAVWIQGDLMGANSVIPFTEFTDVDIPPGGYVIVSINFEAPSPAGRHKGYWMLRSADGITFGLGTNGREWFWVDIESREPVP